MGPLDLEQFFEAAPSAKMVLVFVGIWIIVGFDRRIPRLWHKPFQVILLRSITETPLLDEHGPDDDVVIKEHAQDKDHEAHHLSPVEVLPAHSQAEQPDEQGAHTVQHHTCRGAQLLGHTDARKVKEGDAQHRPCNTKCPSWNHVEQYVKAALQQEIGVEDMQMARPGQAARVSHKTPDDARP